ncbi:MAG: ThiF family adenylyltransferase, partial [Alphaproteobacteria bacterium]|nr:ThiF family adenylyltransferase [Alphaproteobacteria bacterium]
MGVVHLKALDFDSVEVVNRDRLLHSTRLDALLKRAKVKVLGRALRKSATATSFKVDELEWSIIEEEGYREALDCDVLFCCVDRPWPRNILNFIAYAHLIPVVDGGIYLKAKPGGKGLRDADWRAHVAAPERRCLECLGQYRSGDVALERDGYLDDPTYIDGLEDGHPLKRNENVFAFSMSAAAFEVLQFLAMVVVPGGFGNPGAQMYHFKTATLDHEKEDRCNEGCFFTSIIAKGECTGVKVTALHPRAEQWREARRAMQKRWRYCVVDWLERYTDWILGWFVL